MPDSGTLYGDLIEKNPTCCVCDKPTAVFENGKPYCWKHDRENFRREYEAKRVALWRRHLSERKYAELVQMPASAHGNLMRNIVTAVFMWLEDE